MTRPAWWQRFLVKGVFWRQFLQWAVLNIPISIEPLAIGWWSMFFLLWGPGRRGVMRNLSAILPGSSPIANFFRTYRVFWNYAWTITDNMRFHELRTVPDWDFEGWEHFEAMRDRPGGSILLTAHMGSYDLGAHVFSATSDRRITMVRAPETDPATRRYEEERAQRGEVHVEFNTNATDLALSLLDAVRGGEIVAIQGDRVTPGITDATTKLFGKSARVPAGPFALAMTARVPIYPIFVIRAGRRRYRLVAFDPIEVTRQSRDRDADLGKAVAIWTERLERVIRESWFQWFEFEPFSEELEA